MRRETIEEVRERGLFFSENSGALGMTCLEPLEQSLVNTGWGYYRPGDSWKEDRMDGYWIPVTWCYGYNRDEIKRLVPEGWEEVNIESYRYVKEQLFHRDPTTGNHYTSHDGFMMDALEYSSLEPEDQSGFRTVYA